MVTPGQCSTQMHYFLFVHEKERSKKAEHDYCVYLLHEFLSKSIVVFAGC